MKPWGQVLFFNMSLASGSFNMPLAPWGQVLLFNMPTAMLKYKT